MLSGDNGPTRGRVPIPFEIQDVASILVPALERCPEAEALVGRHERYSFRELDREVDCAAHMLLGLGLKPGDRVGMSLRNDPALIIAFLACQRLALIWVGIGRHLSPREKLVIFDDAELGLYIATGHDIARLEEQVGDRGGPAFVDIEPGAPSTWSRGLAAADDRGRPRYASIDPWAPAALAYTSGTTGAPKGAVLHQHAMLCAVASPIAFNRGGQWDPGLRRGVTLPLTTLNIMIQAPFLAMLGGQATVCIDRADAAGTGEWIVAETIQSLSAAPATILDLLTDPAIPSEHLDPIKFIIAGGGDVPERLRDLYRARFGVGLTVGYGLTEAPAALASVPADAPEVPGSSGTPHDHVEIAILDAAGNRLLPGQHGEVCARARRDGSWANVYTPMIGYWRQAASTAAVIGDGWLHTGDLGSIDDKGHVYIHARQTDVIIRGGSNIYPAEVEQVIADDPEVISCAVVGRPDERLGEVVVAVIETKTDVPASLLRERLMSLCATNLAKYKVPIDWIFVDEMPRNAMGKVVKGELMQRI